MNLHPAIVFALMGLFCSTVALFAYWRVRTWQKLVKPDDPFYTITDGHAQVWDSPAAMTAQWWFAAGSNAYWGAVFFIIAAVIGLVQLFS